jgi:Zn-dependent oligopeptidase
VAAEKNIKESGQWDKLSSEEKRLVDKMILDGKRAGLALPEKERDELMALKKELSQACLEFSVSKYISMCMIYKLMIIQKNFNEENVWRQCVCIRRGC